MAKGLKMHSAKKKGDGDTIYPIEDLSASDNEKLLCDSCLTEIIYVSGYNREASGRYVSEYLRLASNGEHKNNCKYSVMGALKKLISDSKDIEEASDIFDEKDNNYIFRMNVLIDAERSAKELANDANEDSKVKEGNKKRVEYVRNEKQLASYFRSALGIAKIKALIEDSSDERLLTEKIKIQFKNTYVTWNDFYYDEDRYHVLFNRLSSGKIKYPIAINVTPKRVNKPSLAAKHFPWSYQCYRDNQKEELIYIPTIRFASEKMEALFKIDQAHLVVASAWSNFKEDSPFRNINLGVHNPAQFCLVNV